MISKARAKLLLREEIIRETKVYLEKGGLIRKDHTIVFALTPPPRNEVKERRSE